MTDRVEISGLHIARELHDFVVEEVIPGTGIDAHDFWAGFSAIVHELGPRNRALLKRRDELQEKIDAWYRDNGAPSDMEAYKGFLSEIGYLVPEGVPFKVTTGECRPGDRHHRRAAARRAGDECALCAERRQRPLGFALRRALRHRRHSRDGRRGEGQGLQSRSAAQRSSPGRATSSTRRVPLDGASWKRRARLLGRGRQARGRARRRQERPA